MGDDDVDDDVDSDGDLLDDEDEDNTTPKLLPNEACGLCINDLLLAIIVVLLLLLLLLSKLWLSDDVDEAGEEEPDSIPDAFDVADDGDKDGPPLTIPLFNCTTLAAAAIIFG